MLGSSPYSRSDSPFAPTPELWESAAVAGPEHSAPPPGLKKPLAYRPSSVSGSSSAPVFDPSRLFELATTCHGSRILQDEVGKMRRLGDAVELHKVAVTVLCSGRLTDLCMDKFGNYFVQALLGALDEKMLVRFASALTCEAGPLVFAKLCVHPFGSHVIQILINLGKENRTVSTKIVDAITPNLLFIATDFLGSICMVQAIKSLPSGTKLLSTVAPLTKELAVSRHGHTVLIECLEQGSSQTLGMIEKNFVDNLEALVANDFGFRVLVHALELEKIGKVSPKHSRVRLFVRSVEFTQTSFRLIDYIIRNFEDHEAVQLELIPRIVDIVKAGHLNPQDA